MNSESTKVPLTRNERLRRVVLVCCHFMRNLAFYRIGRNYPSGWAIKPLKPNADFWRTANGNFLDVCVLEWCKLLGDKRGRHFYGNIVSDVTRFETELLRHLNIDAVNFDSYRNSIRDYRDKFVAHLDFDRIMNIPFLDVARSSVEFYHAHLVNHEVQSWELANLPDSAEKLRAGYEQCEAEATRVYQNLEAVL